MNRTRPLSYYLGLNYPFRAQIDPDDGSFYVDFPDLPGCMTGADTLEELAAMIKEATLGWLTVTYETGRQMPKPTQLHLDEPSGKFNVRLPRSLHGELSEWAGQNGVSLNQYVVSLLSRGDAQARIEERLARVEAALGGVATAAVARVADERTAYQTGKRPRAASAKKAIATKAATARKKAMA